MVHYSLKALRAELAGACVYPQALRLLSDGRTMYHEMLVELPTLGWETFARNADRLGRAEELHLSLTCRGLQQAAQLRLPRVAVNVPAAVLSAAFAVELLGRARDAGLDRRLIVEIGESDAHEELEDAVAQLRAAGTGCVVDDYGHGVSDLARVRRLGLSAVKLAPAAVQLPDTDSFASLLRSIPRGTFITVTGLDDFHQVERAVSFGVPAGQGHALSVPGEQPGHHAGTQTAGTQTAAAAGADTVRDAVPAAPQPGPSRRRVR